MYQFVQNNKYLCSLNFFYDTRNPIKNYIASKSYNPCNFNWLALKLVIFIVDSMLKTTR